MTFIARPISLALRLFGNMYAGELIFILIALLPFCTMGIVCALGDLPYSYYHVTSIHFHDADYRVHEYGNRKALINMAQLH